MGTLSRRGPLQISKSISTPGRGWSIDAQIIGMEDLQQRLMKVGVYSANTGLWGKRYAEIIKRNLAQATDTWRHKPGFDIRVVYEGNNRAKVQISTNSKIFGFVNAGTRPHWIRPRKPGGTLAFNSKFEPKTRPGSLRSGPGFSGPPMVFSKGVWHPGVAPRHFDELAARESQREGSETVLRNVMQRWGGRLQSGA